MLTPCIFKNMGIPSYYTGCIMCNIFFFLMVIISFILDIIKFYLKWFQELKKITKFHFRVIGCILQKFPKIRP